MLLVLIILLSGCSNYNRPPLKPTAVYPENGEKGVPFDLTLSWSGGDPDGDAVTYAVYLGQGDLKPLGETTLTTLNVHLESYGTYRWKVVAKDQYEKTSESDTWTFSTKDPPEPSVDEIVVVGDDEMEVVDVSSPLNPRLKKTVLMPGVSSVYIGENDAYAAGCSWLAKLDKDDFHELWRVETPGCARDITVDKYIFLSMGEKGIEHLDPSSPSTNGVIENYSEGMDSAFGKIYVAAGNGGIYEIDASNLDVSTITTNRWVSDVKWSGNALYFKSGSGVGKLGGGFFTLEDVESFDVKEYMVYVLSRDVLHILDFSDIPTEISSITLDGAKDVKAVGDYIYAVGDEFYAVDVSDPRNPMVTGVNESIKGIKFAQN